MPHCHEITINPSDGSVKFIITATGELTITQHFPADKEEWLPDDRVTLPPHGAYRAEIVGVRTVLAGDVSVRLLQIDERREVVDAWVAGAMEALKAVGYEVEVIRE